MTWVKICGITNLEDALLSVEAGANALGFIFAESPRRITPSAAKKIAAKLPAHIEKVGVFVNEAAQEIRRIAEQVGLTAVQLYGDDYLQTSKTIKELRTSVQDTKSPMKIVQVLSVPDWPELEELNSEFWIDDNRLVDALLFDSKGETLGGTGKRFDWTRLAQHLGAMKTVLPPVIVAGGLTPQNVSEAIHVWNPWGVDVVSGVERQPGKKDPAKVKAFVQAVRDAEKNP